MPSRMRRPEDVRIALNDDDWIVVKKFLTAGEERQMNARLIKRIIPGERPELDPLQVGLSQVAEYLLDWSILDADGTPVIIRGRAVEVKLATINDLPVEKYDEIYAAVMAHIEAMRALLEKEKNVPAGETASSPTSVSAA